MTGKHYDWASHYVYQGLVPMAHLVSVAFFFAQRADDTLWFGGPTTAKLQKPSGKSGVTEG